MSTSRASSRIVPPRRGGGRVCRELSNTSEPRKRSSLCPAIRCILTSLSSATRLSRLRESAMPSRRVRQVSELSATALPATELSHCAVRGLSLGRALRVRPDGGVVTQRTANPCTPVRFRLGPPGTQDIDREQRKSLKNGEFGRL